MRIVDTASFASAADSLAGMVGAGNTILVASRGSSFSTPPPSGCPSSSQLIDQLQHAAWLWSQNLTDRLAAYRGQLGETRWSAMSTLGQAVAECLPDGDEDRRIILGLLGSNVTATAARPNGDNPQGRLPGIDDNEEETGG